MSPVKRLGVRKACSIASAYHFWSACTPALIAILIAPAGVRADSVNSPNIAMNVDTNRSTGPGAGNTAVAVSTITLAETNVNEYASGAGKAITLRVRPGFQFDPTSNVSAQSASFGINGAGANVATFITPTGAADEVITFNLTSGGTVAQDIIRINGIKLKILNAAGAAGPAQATLLLSTSPAGGAFTNQGIVAATLTKGAPDRLVFAIQPGNTQAANDLLPVVKIVDFGGNLVTTSDRTISLAIQQNPGVGVLLGNNQHASVIGLATWVDADDLRILVAGANYTLRASHDGAPFLTSDFVDSSTFDITAGPPGRLQIATQPTDTAAGADIVIAVSVLDSLDNLVTLGSVNVTLDSAVNPAGWPLLVDTSLTKGTVNGVASWNASDHLRINKQVSGYRLSASGVGAPVQTDAFNITAAAPNAVQFVQQPTDAARGATISPPVTVEIIDAFSNRTDAAVNVHLALFTASCGGTVSGGDIASVAGLATFNDVKINTACNGDVLRAFATGLVEASSNPFNVTQPFGLFAPCGVCGAGVVSTVAPILLAQMVLHRRRRRLRRV